MLNPRLQTFLTCLRQSLYTVSVQHHDDHHHLTIVSPDGHAEFSLGFGLGLLAEDEALDHLLRHFAGQTATRRYAAVIGEAVGPAV